MLEDLARTGRHLLGRLDHHRADVEDAGLDGLVLGQVRQEFDACHVAVGVVEDPLVDARRVPEVGEHRLVAVGEVRAEDVVAPRVAEAEVPPDLGVDALAALSDDVLDPVVVSVVAGEQREPGAEILELEVGRPGRDEILHLGVEDRRERVAELLRVLVVLEVRVPREVDRSGADGDLHRAVRQWLGDLVEVAKANRAARDRAAVDDAAPVVHQRHDPVIGGPVEPRLGGMGLARRIEARDPLVHVPAEGADHADVVVVGHLAVGDDVEPGLLLVADHRRGGVGVGLLVPHVLEGDADVAPVQLIAEPMRPRVGADHGGRQDRVDDLRQGHAPLSSGGMCRAGLRLDPAHRCLAEGGEPVKLHFTPRDRRGCVS